MSSTILNRYRESEQLCLVPDFTGIVLMLACQFIMVTNGRGRKIIIFGGNMLLLGCFCSSAWTHIHIYREALYGLNELFLQNKIKEKMRTWSWKGDVLEGTEAVGMVWI